MTETAGKQALGRRLAEWRTAAGLSLTEAGRRIGVHPTTYQRWERGRRPYPRHLDALAEVLGEDVAALTALAGPGPRRTGRPPPADASALMKPRIAAELTRVVLGRALHVGPATVHQWERGTTRPPADVLPRLARLLRLDPDELDAALADHPPYRFDGEVLPGLGAVLRRHGWPRRQVQRLLGVAPSTVFEWETGRTRVPTWALQRLTVACGVEMEVLITHGRRRTRPERSATSLKAMRRRARMTQREAAAVLGISPSSLGRYENGRRPVGLPLARAMARVYRI